MIKSNPSKRPKKIRCPTCGQMTEAKCPFIDYCKPSNTELCISNPSKCPIYMMTDERDWKEWMETDRKEKEKKEDANMEG